MKKLLIVLAILLILVGMLPRSTNIWLGYTERYAHTATPTLEAFPTPAFTPIPVTYSYNPNDVLSVCYPKMSSNCICWQDDNGDWHDMCFQ